MSSPQALEEAVDRYNATYEQGSDEWFDSFSESATVFAIGQARPIQGRDAYRDAFGSLLNESRQVEVLSRDVQVTNGTAVVMQLVRVTQAAVVTTFRESTIWNQGPEGWKVVHLHTALAAPSVPSDVRELATDADSVRVLGERLATSSSQVGIAQ